MSVTCDACWHEEVTFSLADMAQQTHLCRRLRHALEVVTS